MFKKIISLLLLSSALGAQTLPKVPPLTVKATVNNTTLPAGSSTKLRVTAKILDGYHINSHTPEEKFLIPTVLELTAINDISFGKITYPAYRRVKLPFAENEMVVYEGSVTFMSSVIIDADLSPGPVTISGILHYQACNDQLCFAPDEVEFSVPLTITKKVAATPVTAPATAQPQQGAEIATGDEQQAQAILDKGIIYAAIAFFLFGLALNLTPCVYPVIPITISFFAKQNEERKGSTFVLALFYVLGIALIFALLGLISALLGKQWGFLFQNSWFVIIISLVVLAMAANMFGAFEISLPTSLMASSNKVRQGILGSLAMGLMVGFIIAPCAAGIIIGLVSVVAKSAMIVRGTLLFFIMGLGLGLPYLFLGTFSGLFNALPRSGMWMTWVKKVFGMVLIGIAVYFLLPHIERSFDAQAFIFGVLLLFSGLFLGFLDHDPGYSKIFKISKAFIGTILIIVGIVFVQNSRTEKITELSWNVYSNEFVGSFSDNKRPAMLDFYADWCAPCKEMDQKTFTDAEVIKKLKKFNLIKVDCTAPNDKITRVIEKFKVKGLPTFVFLDKKGNEIKESRLVGFVNAEDFLKYLK